MKEKRHFVRNIESTDYTPTVRAVYDSVTMKFKNSARITNLLDMLKYTFGFKEWLLFDPKTFQSAQFTSYLVDRMIDFKEGRDVDFTEVYESILVAGDFVGREKYSFEMGDIEERLWALFMAIDDPYKSINN